MSSLIATYDDYDRIILNHVQRDAAQSLEDLAKAVNLSRNAVWRRLKRLQDSGILRARVALIDAQKVGLGLTVFISISVRTHSKDWAKTLAECNASPKKPRMPLAPQTSFPVRQDCFRAVDEGYFYAKKN